MTETELKQLVEVIYGNEWTSDEGPAQEIGAWVQGVLDVFGLRAPHTYTLGELEAIRKAIAEALKS